VPAGLAALVMHLLQKHPADRPQSAEQVLQVLDAVPTSRTSGYSSTPWRPEHVASRPGVRLAVAAVVLALAGYGGYTAWRLRAPAPARPAAAERGASPGTAPAVATRPSVAVLPFVNTSRDPDDEHFSDGLTDELIGALGKVAGLKVTGRTSTFALKGTRLSVRAVAETLGVGTVVEGSVRRAGGRLKVGAQLVSAADGAVLWTETYDRETRDVFAVQEEIAGAIVAALRGQLGAGLERAPFVKRAPADLAVYELYLKGRYVLRSRISRDALLQAIRYFDQAVAGDASYARAHAGLSHAYTVLAGFGYARPHEAFARAKAAARRALALDSTLAEAHAALAHTLFVYDFDWAASEREFRRAVVLDPANPDARRLYALLLQNQGRFDEAVAQLDTARAADPLAPLVNTILGRVYVNARRPAEAIRPLEEALALSPDLDVAYQQLGHAYLQQGRPADAIAALRQAAVLSGLRDSAHLAYAYGVTSQRAEAERVLQALLDPAARREPPAFHIAMAYAGLGEKDAAFQWLERGYLERGAFMDGVKVTPAFVSLHSDPRWGQLLRRMGLEP
jgi:TolB-like protein/tetratricopeptide (TPR) repeat protein